MNPNQTTYEPEEDQNQGVISTMARHNESHDSEMVNTQMPRLDPNLVTNQSGAAIEDDDETQTIETDSADTEDDEELGDNDHHQDDNYALGGHVTRSGGV